MHRGQERCLFIQQVQEECVCDLLAWQFALAEGRKERYAYFRKINDCSREKALVPVLELLLVVFYWYSEQRVRR